MYGHNLTRGVNRVTGVIILLTLALAGCGGGGGGGTIGVSGGDAGNGSGGNNPGAPSSGGSTYTATAIVTSGGVPKPGVTVTLSSGVASTPNPAGVIATRVTDPQGQAVFSGLIKGMNYCFTASFTDNTGSHQAVSCSNTSDTTVLLRL